MGYKNLRHAAGDLEIRLLQESDAKAVLAGLQAEPNKDRLNQHGMGLHTRFTTVASVEALAGTSMRANFAILVNGTFAGSAKLEPRSQDEVEIGIWLLEPFEGQGITRRVMSALLEHAWKHFAIVSGLIAGSNSRSLRAVRHWGPVRSGTGSARGMPRYVFTRP